MWGLIMRKLLAIAVLAAIATAGSALAADTAQQGVMKSCSAKWTAMSAADKAKTKHNDFMSSCMKGPATAAAMPAPAMAMKPAATGTMAMKPAASGSMAMKPAAAGGQAKCKDGTTVTYKTRSGTCSGHKGVATWM
jgi:hypothetical protein